MRYHIHHEPKHLTVMGSPLEIEQALEMRVGEWRDEGLHSPRILFSGSEPHFFSFDYRLHQLRNTPILHDKEIVEIYRYEIVDGIPGSKVLFERSYRLR